MSESIPVIDIHAHVMIPAVEALVRGQPGWLRDQQERAEQTGAASTSYNQKLFGELFPKFTQLELRLAAMDAMGVDIQTVSMVPTYHYWAEPDLAEKIVATTNQAIAELCARRPDRLVGLGTVSLQHPDLVERQLDHAISALGLKGIIVSTNVNGTELADPRLAPFWRKAEALGALVFIHPLGCTLGMRLADHYLSNIVGNPVETTVALSHIVFTGLLDRHPNLKICAAHGGGYFPQYMGRFDHGWHVRPEAHGCQHAPSTYLKQLWFDSLVYDPDVLGHLIGCAGASQVVLGTDYAFDMGVNDPVARLDQVKGLSGDDRDAILGQNAARLLGLHQ